MTKLSDDKSDLKSGPKKRGRKKLETQKGLGLFDHVKQIRIVQDPEYFKNLSDLDKKSFNHFKILKALSMNPALLEDMATIFRYFDKIPSPQLYQLLIGLIPADYPKSFYPWIKSKKVPFNKRLLELISKYFEISQKESSEYATLLYSTDKGKKELEDFCRVYGLTDKEIETVMKRNDDEKE